MKIREFLISGRKVLREALIYRPIIEIIDNSRVLIENYEEIALYEPYIVKLNVRFGTIIVYGDELELDSITTEIVVIKGVINQVLLQREGE